MASSYKAERPTSPPQRRGRSGSRRSIICLRRKVVISKGRRRGGRSGFRRLGNSLAERQASLKVPAAGEYRGQTGVRLSCVGQGLRANPRRPRARERHWGEKATDRTPQSAVFVERSRASVGLPQLA